MVCFETPQTLPAACARHVPLLGMLGSCFFMINYLAISEKKEKRPFVVQDNEINNPLSREKHVSLSRV